MTNQERVKSRLLDSLTDLVNKRGDELTALLADSPDGKLSVGFGARLVLTTGKVLASTKLRFADVTEDKVEWSCEWDDPNQLKIGGVE